MALRRDGLDPVVDLDRKREDAPVVRVARWFGVNAWLVTGYGEVKAVLGSAGAFSNDFSRLVDLLGLAQPTVSKHLRTLRDAGLVEVRVDAQRRLYRIRPEPLAALDAWLAPYRKLWSASLDRLERHLEEGASSTTPSPRTPKAAPPTPP